MVRFPIFYLCFFRTLDPWPRCVPRGSFPPPVLSRSWLLPPLLESPRTALPTMGTHALPLFLLRLFSPQLGPLRKSSYKSTHKNQSPDCSPFSSDFGPSTFPPNKALRRSFAYIISPLSPLNISRLRILCSSLQDLRDKLDNRFWLPPETPFLSSSGVPLIAKRLPYVHLFPCAPQPLMPLSPP